MSTDQSPFYPGSPYGDRPPASLLVGERCAVCGGWKESTVEIPAGEYRGERVCSDCLTILVRAGRLGRDDGKRMVEAQAQIVGERGGLKRRHHKQ